MAGIRDGLAAEKIDQEAIVLKANRDKKSAAENFRKLDAMNLSVIYSLSSAGTQIAKELNLKTPVVATVVNHPASLGVMAGKNPTGTQLSGTSYYVDANKQLNLYRSLFGAIKTIGMIYDKNNPAGALAEMPFMKKAAESAGAQFIAIGITKKNEVAPAADKLIARNAELIVVPTNRLVYANLGPVLEKAFAKRIPVVSMNKQGVENGALAALFADTYNLGRRAAVIARRIIRDGVPASELGFEYSKNPKIIINFKSAKRLSFKFPVAIVGQAEIILQ
jgi:putative ABC transport system substrate-binding protein